MPFPLHGPSSHYAGANSAESAYKISPRSRLRSAFEKGRGKHLRLAFKLAQWMNDDGDICLLVTRHGYRGGDLNQSSSPVTVPVRRVARFSGVMIHTRLD